MRNALQNAQTKATQLVNKLTNEGGLILEEEGDLERTRETTPYLDNILTKWNLVSALVDANELFTIGCVYAASGKRHVLIGPEQTPRVMDWSLTKMKDGLDPQYMVNQVSSTSVY